MTGYDSAAFDVYEERGWGGKDAPAYDSLAGRVTSRFAAPLLDAARVQPGMRVLDCATGPGYVAELAAELGATVVGIDFSTTMLALARSRVQAAEFVEGDATSLPFADESFDAVISGFVLLHLGTPERAVAEAVRVVASGGRVAYTVWDIPSRGRWLGVMLDAVAAAGAVTPVHIPAGPPLFQFADDDRFRALLVEGGLVEVAIETIDDTLEIAGSQELWNGLLDGTVRVGPLVSAQTEDMQRSIREQFDDLLTPYRTQDGYAVPVSAKLAAGTKP